MLCLFLKASTQDAPNNSNMVAQSPEASQSGKLASMPVNLFTGIPQVSIPIYHFSSPNGLSLNVSLDYVGGGIRTAQTPTAVGLGWHLSAGGMISRTVRGMPDDVANYGYLYAPAIGTDIRADANKYYYDSLDAQQDVFHYNFDGHSGRFFFGKNGQIITVPDAKIKIIPRHLTSPYAQSTLTGFSIVTENGVKYEFALPEYVSTFVMGGSHPSGHTGQLSGYFGRPYTSAWHLTTIISPSNADTIRLNYTVNTELYDYYFPQVSFVLHSNGAVTNYRPNGRSSYQYKALSSIEFPGKVKMNLTYSKTVTHDGINPAIWKIKVMDSVFRFGYMLEYKVDNDTVRHTPGPNGHGVPDPEPDVIIRRPILLQSVTPFTRSEKQHPYRFEYHRPIPLPNSENDTISHRRDHWGFFNRLTANDDVAPRVPPFTWGADRSPNYGALQGMLYKYHLPSGGFIQYTYGLNEHLPFTRSVSSVSLYPASGYSGIHPFHQVFTNKHRLNFTWAGSRTGNPPIWGNGGLVCAIKSTDNQTTYATTQLSLYELFYQGIKNWSFSLPQNGNYRIEFAATAGTTFSVNPLIDIKWNNTTEDTSKPVAYSGGLRVDAISRYTDSGVRASIDLYRYVEENGRSSGFLGDVPKYDYPYREIIHYNGTATTNDYTIISSEPVHTADYSQGSLAGYRRVEIAHGYKNLYLGVHGNNYTGKEVYEFTDLKEANSTGFEIAFPFTPHESKTWALGAPKQITVFDTLGRVLKKTKNLYRLDTVSYLIADFKSMRLGNTETVYYGLPSSGTAGRVKTFIAEDYYPQGGKLLLAATYDTVFHADGTKNTAGKQFEYDSYYNLKKLTEDFDVNRGLKKETRFYYPHDYTIGGVIGLMRDSGMKSTVVASETWVVGDNNPRLIGGAISSFRQIANGEIKPDVSYVLQTGKPLPQSLISVFDPAQLNRNSTYFKAQAQVASYDADGNAAQVTNLVSGRSSASLYDYNGLYLTAKVDNATAADFAFTSFEAMSNGNWIVSHPARTNASAITGKKSFSLDSGTLSKSGLNAAHPYLVTLWVKAGAMVQINGSAITAPIAAQQGWNLFSKELNGITTVSITGSGLIDEVRLHPKDANMVTYTYEPLVGATSTTDANNTIVYTEYDALNRVEFLRDKDRNIIKRFSYSDSAMKFSDAPVWVFTRIRCTNAAYDSVFTDVNPYSDSHLTEWAKYFAFNPCDCGDPSQYPNYKLVNGVCEQGVKVITSNAYVRVWDPSANAWVRMWRCEYYYRWSDGSTSASFESYSTSQQDCFVGGGVWE